MPTRYTLDNIRVEGVGIRLGVNSTALVGVIRKTSSSEEWPAKKAALSRTFLTLALPLEVKIWNRPSPGDFDWTVALPVYQKLSNLGFMADDSRFLPYWRKDAPVVSSQPQQVIVSTHSRPGKALIIVSNLKKLTTVALHVDLAQISLSASASCTDLETEMPVDIRALKIADYDFRLIEMK